MTVRPDAATELERLHHGATPLVVLNVWDVFSAKIAERAGARCIGTSSAAVARALGYEDGEMMPRSEMIAAVARIASATKLPVTADLEAGYGATPDDVAETVRLALESGVVGFNIEDGYTAAQRRDRKAPLRQLSEQVERLRAAREACDRAGVPDVVINARVAVFVREVGPPEARVDLTLERAAAYVAAGARCIFPIMVRDRAAIGALVKGIAAPMNVLALPGLPSLRELADLGVPRLSLGGGWHRQAMAAAEQAARAVLGDGDLTALWTTP